MRDEHRGRLDRAIDRAVRDMVQVDPRPGLGGRVAKRIERPAADRFAFGHLQQRVPALAAVAILAILVASFALYNRPVDAPARAPELASNEPHIPPVTAASPAAPDRTAAAAQPAAPAAPRAAAPAPPRASDRPTRPAIFDRRTGRVSAANIGPAPEVVPQTVPESGPLPEPSGVVAPLAPITIAPIQIAPIALSPVTVNARPGGR